MFYIEATVLKCKKSLKSDNYICDLYDGSDLIKAVSKVALKENTNINSKCFVRISDNNRLFLFLLQG